MGWLGLLSGGVAAEGVAAHGGYRLSFGLRRR